MGFWFLWQVGPYASGAVMCFIDHCSQDRRAKLSFILKWCVPSLAMRDVEGEQSFYQMKGRRQRKL